MEERIRLEIVTPERLLLSEDVDEVVAPGHLGEFGVLPEHTPFLALLDIGILKYRVGTDETQLAVSGGFAEARRRARCRPVPLASHRACRFALEQSPASRTR